MLYNEMVRDKQASHTLLNNINNKLDRPNAQ